MYKYVQKVEYVWLLKSCNSCRRVDDAAASGPNSLNDAAASDNTSLNDAATSGKTSLNDAAASGPTSLNVLNKTVHWKCDIVLIGFHSACLAQTRLLLRLLGLLRTKTDYFELD